MSVSMSLGGRPPAHHTARQCAIAALEAGNLNGQTDGPRSGTAFVPATSWRERLTNSGCACARGAWHRSWRATALTTSGSVSSKVVN